MENKKTTTADLELLVANHFGVRQNLIVPNVYWGWKLPYEADLVVVTRARCAYEIELKISKSDLKADAKKKWGHNGKMFRGLWFAMPEKIYDEKYVPERAGVLLAYWQEYKDWKTDKIHQELALKVVRKPKLQKVNITEKQYIKLLELASMRIWKLKTKLNFLKNKY